MAVASLVLGIVSIVCGVFGFGLRLGGAVLAVIGIILGAKNKEAEKAPTAKAGKTCSVIGLIICLLIFTVSAICASIFHTVVGAELLEELMNLLREII